MRSIPQALLWETLSQGRWSLPGLFLLGNGLPLLVYGSLCGMGVNTADPAFVVLQSAFLPLVILQFSIGVAVAQGPMARLYTSPVSSNAIVAWHTLSGAAILALETALAAWMYNWLFHAEWPILGSMLFAAVAWSALQLLQFIPSQPSLSGLFFSSMPLFVSLLWVTSRYGSWLSPPTHYWREVTLVDVAVLAIIAGICYAMNMTGVRFARCGEALPRIGVSKWLIQVWESLGVGTSENDRFRSAIDAQLWYEFRLKGWGLPFLSALVMSLALTLVAFGVIVAPDKLNGAYEFILVLGVLLSAFALLLGAVFAIENSSIPGEKRDRGLGDVSETFRFESMGGFLAVRPISDTQFSRVMLWVVAKSVALSNALWLVVLLIAFLAMWFTNHMPHSLSPQRVGAWILPLNLLGPWICMANAASVAFLARRTVKFLFAGFALVMGYFFLTASMQLPRDMVQTVHVVSITVVSALIVILTLWVFHRCRRANQLTSKAQILSATLAAGILIAAFGLRPADSPLVAFPLALAFAALAVLPFAAMPLTISASRHR